MERWYLRIWRTGKAFRSVPVHFDPCRGVFSWHLIDIKESSTELSSEFPITVPVRNVNTNIALMFLAVGFAVPGQCILRSLPSAITVELAIVPYPILHHITSHCRSRVYLWQTLDPLRFFHTYSLDLRVMLTVKKPWRYVYVFIICTCGYDVFMNGCICMFIQYISLSDKNSIHDSPTNWNRHDIQ